MKQTVAAVILATFATPTVAESTSDFVRSAEGAGSVRELEPYIHCAPYARKVSGVQIFGDARTWWSQAQGRYATGTAPRVGAVMVFRPHRSMQMGHVAAVSQVIDSRRVLLDHANWSPVDGRRGQVEKDVLAVDVSPRNDWSQVRVWYAPLGDVGTSVWPVDGFIYATQEGPALRKPTVPMRTQTSRQFLSAFAEFSK